ncbi:major facilitator superfamily domain-containing protein [Xylogone sp. PMI_703]|nr:major facilitator superfamily domain-containing protein [Xylogone sp. PMI_703]
MATHLNPSSETSRESSDVQTRLFDIVDLLHSRIGRAEDTDSDLPNFSESSEQSDEENAKGLSRKIEGASSPSPPPPYPDHDSEPPVASEQHTNEKLKLDPWAEKYRCFSVPEPDAPQEVEDESQYPKGVRMGLMVSALCLTISLVALDSTIVSTAAPTLASQWHALTSIGWFGSAYLLPLPTLQPLFGKMYPYFNTKYGFLAGLTLFEVGSLICAQANSAPMFIGGRTVAGIGAALLAPGVLLIVTDTVPRKKRPIYTGITALAAGTAACLGPILGGIFTTKVSWRWCFYINLPLGAATALAMAFLYHPRQRKPRNIPIREILVSLDLPGCFFLCSSVISLLLSFTFAAESSWSDGKTIALIVLAAVLLLGLIVQQLLVNEDQAMLPRSILRKRGILICSWFGFLAELSTTAHVYYLPFYFQGVNGASAEKSGVDLLPYLLSQTIAGIMTGVLINFTGYFNPPMIFGTILFSIGAGFLQTLSVNTTSAQWIGFQILAAFGAGCSQFMAMGIAQQLLSKDEESIGLSMVYTIKQLGSAISVSLCSTIFNNRLSANLAKHHLSEDIVDQIRGSLILHIGRIPAEVKAIVGEAVASSVDSTFIVPIVAGVLAFLVGSVHKWTKI